MRLIDADALKAALMETKAESGNVGEVIAKVFCGVIDEQLEAVVRCKDCRYYHADEAVNSQCGDCGIWAKKLVDHGYCFMGKRREDDGDKETE